jgi:DNA (cytosine-5)-methyltransferase 1
MKIAGCVGVEWETVRQVVAGHGVRRVLKCNELADLWSVDQSEVLKLAGFLRELGYEVRSSKTNPQLPRGALLVPYCFPTLSRKSVQRHKELC